METYKPFIPLTTSNVSLYNLCVYIYRKIATHPLITAPLVRNPLTNEVVMIEKYKLKNGLEPDGERLTCSIFPHSTPTDGLSLPKPAETSLSTLFIQDQTIGNRFDNGIYHIAVKLHYNTQSIFIPHPNEELKVIPADAMVHYSQQGYINNNAYKKVELDMNPALPILSDYLEYVRLAILDREQEVDYYVPVRNISVMYFNLKDAPWEKNRSVYFSEAEILVRLDILVGREWRQNLINQDTNTCSNFKVSMSQTENNII